MAVGAFQIGEIVRLRSGGPHMTVASEPDQGGYVTCAWFLKDTDKFVTQTFPPATLLAVPGEELTDEQLRDIINRGG